MDLKITFDVTPALADVAKCLCRALELRSTHAHVFRCAAAHVEPQKADAPAKVENSPVEAPEPVDVPKPAPIPENAADVKPGAVAAQIDAPEPVQVEQAAEPQAEQSTEPQAEQSTEPQAEPAPVEAPKAKRSHHKKAAPEPAPSPEPVQVAEPEPQPAPEPQAEPASAEPAPAEIPNALTIDDVRAVGVKLGAAGKQSVIIDYLKAHGCKSLSQLDPGCYAELIEIGKAAL